MEITGEWRGWASNMEETPGKWKVDEKLGAVHTYENNLFFLRHPRRRFKNICVHTDPPKTTENTVVHI